MGRGNAPYSASAASVDQFGDEDYENILFEDPIDHPVRLGGVHPIDQDTPPPSVEDQNRSLDMPYLGDIPVDMTEIFNLQDQFQQQQQPQQQEQQQQQQRQIGQTPLSYSDQDYHMVPFITGQPTPASTTATSPPSSPPEDTAVGTPAGQMHQNHPNLGDLLSSDLNREGVLQQHDQQQQQQQQISQTPHPYSDASYQPPTSVLSHTSEMSEADAGVTVSNLTMLEKKRTVCREKKKSKTGSDMAIQTKKRVSSSRRNRDLLSSAESEVEDLSSKQAKAVIHVQREASEWLSCKVIGCPFWTNKKERMERHLTCHPNMFSKNLKCPDCDMKFYSLAKMLKHDRKKHTGVKDYECRICGAEVTEIQVHMKVSYLSPHALSSLPSNWQNHSIA